MTSNNSASGESAESHSERAEFHASGRCDADHRMSETGAPDVAGSNDAHDCDGRTAR